MDQCCSIYSATVILPIHFLAHAGIALRDQFGFRPPKYSAQPEPLARAAGGVASHLPVPAHLNIRVALFELKQEGL
jgi:hypothetical protein